MTDEQKAADNLAMACQLGHALHPDNYADGLREAIGLYEAKTGDTRYGKIFDDHIDATRYAFANLPKLKWFQRLWRWIKRRLGL